MNKEQIESRLDAYLDAESKILGGQSVDMNGKKLTRADLGIVSEKIDQLRRELARLSRTGKQRKPNSLARF